MYIRQSVQVADSWQHNRQECLQQNNLCNSQNGRKREFMKYSIRVNEVKNKDGNLRGFATVVFGDSFKVTNIAILESKEKGQLFVSMPRYKSNERDENGNVYKDVCNPITKEFREELYGNILEAYENLQKQEQNQERDSQDFRDTPEFSVSVTPFERDGSNIRGLARIYFEDSFIVNNVNILQGKENLFVAMPSYKSKQIDEHGKPVYQEVCYPVTKEFREKLYQEIISTYVWEVQQREEKNRKQDHGHQQVQRQTSYDGKTSFR